MLDYTTLYNYIIVWYRIVYYSMSYHIIPLDEVHGVELARLPHVLEELLSIVIISITLIMISSSSSSSSSSSMLSLLPLLT